MSITQTFDELDLSFDIIVPDTAAVIVAAGSSTRMDGVSKQLEPIFGIPSVIRAAMAFEKCDRINSIIVAARPEEIPEMQRLFSEYNISKLTDIVEGGETRARSVQKGVERCRNCRFVAIHDGARPLVTDSIIQDTIDIAEKLGAAAAAVPVKDTIKEVNEVGKVLATPDRNTLMSVQTPQTFAIDRYREAVEKAGDDIDLLTDDCAIMEAAGFEVFLTEGSYTNIKITTPEDLAAAEAFLMKAGQ